jgi:ATP-binding cassette subfamily F protein 3
MSQESVILRFDKIKFYYDEYKPILEEANFSVRKNTKLTIMGPNGAGKSTLFGLITGELTPVSGNIFKDEKATVAIARQVMDEVYKDLSVREYFATAFGDDVPRNLDKLIDDVLEVVNYPLPKEKVIRDLSGGQQARLLLAYALIQNPDILLLDEPTNNLDEDGIGHLTTFLIMYEKTVLVISHDTYFLNSFTDGVLHLDQYSHTIKQYNGNYIDVLEEINAQVEREQRKNAQLLKSIQDKKDKVNFFANKGGKMRKLASKLREEIEEDEASLVDVVQEDKTISPFKIPAQEYKDAILTLSKVAILKDGVQVEKDIDISLRKGQRLFIKGPNGIGKSTLLKAIAEGASNGSVIGTGVRVAYYKQDFSGLNFDQTAFQALEEMMGVPDKEEVYRTAAKFLLTSKVLQTKVGSLSEGQKGLLVYARFVLQEPGLIILDEPTNHINFRHLPVIAKAIDEYEGAMILVSHVPEFVEQVRMDKELDLGRL